MEDRPPDAPVPPNATVPPVPPPPPGFAPPPPGYAPPPPPAGPPARAPIPWEDPARPKFAAFFETIGLLYSRTREAFERMPLTSDVLWPYVFGILAGWIGLAVNALWDMALRGVMQQVMRNMGAERADYGAVSAFLTGPLTIVTAPVIVAVGVLVGSLVYHLFLLMLGSAKSGFAATLRVCCYAQASTLLQVLPVCGGLAALVVQVVFTIVGFSAAHRITNGRAAAAVLLPLVLCCVCGAIAFAIGGAAMIGAFRQSMGR